MMVLNSCAASRFVMAIAVPVAAWACTSDAGTRNATTRRDSAGIVIIESRAAAWPAGGGWKLSPEPVVQIGSADGPPETQLFRVQTVRRLPDGRIIVANSGTNEVRVYSSTGQHIRTIGREGQGPGEFRSPRNFWLLPGDSLLVVDLDRASVFDSAGQFIRSESFGMIDPQDRFDDGSYLRVVFAAGVDAYALGASRPRYAIVRATRMDGSDPDTLTELPGSDTYRISPDGNNIAAYSPPFGRRRMVMVHESSIYTGDGSDFEVWELDTRGAPVRIMRRVAEAEPVTSDAIQAAEQAMLERAQYEVQRQRLWQLFREWKHPPTQPFFDEIVIDLDGNVWTRLFQAAPHETRQWTVFDADGSWLGEVEMPAELIVKQIGRDYVLGLWRDTLNVEYVRVHSLEKPSLPDS
jgi:hypothetical protein